MKSPINKILVRLLIGLILVAALIYISEPGSILSAFRTANPRYILLSVLFYPLIMIFYAFRWQFVLSMMGDYLPLGDAHQAVAAGAFVSDFTPARLGDFLKPLMVKDRIDVSKGMASVILDHWVDFMTTALLGMIGLLGVLHMRNWHFLVIIFLSLFSVIAFLSLILLKKDLTMNAVYWINYNRITHMAGSFYRAIDHVEDEPRLVEVSIIITGIIWVALAIRIAILIKAFGYNAPIVELIFLLPLVNMLSSLPITISGLGLVEGGMVLLATAIGEPPSVGLSVALLDRGLSMAYHAIVGSRYASRLL